MITRSATKLAACAAFLLSLSSCQLLYFVAGQGSQDALYKFPKKQRVLVFIDSTPAVSLPPDGASRIATAIGDHLYKNKVTDVVVGQDRMSELRRRPDFAKLGIADVAQALDADVVLYVNIVAFHVELTSADNVSQGSAETLVKVIDRNGKRLWPAAEVAGHPADAEIEPKLTDSHEKTTVYEELYDRLALHVGRMFHSYDLEDKEMTK